MTWVSTGDEQPTERLSLLSVHHSAALLRESGQVALAEAVVSGQFEPLAARLRALLEYAVALTVSPRSVQQVDVERLQDVGLSAAEIIDANQVVAYFNYVNRVAEGLGVELEPTWPNDVRQPRHYPLRCRRPAPGH
jgi:uncharacterized peroxidase-related enzyme